MYILLLSLAIVNPIFDMAENSRFRQRLFVTLRLGVVVNIVCSLLFFASVLYNRSRVRGLEDSVIALSLRNSDLSSRLELALFTLTNDYFRAAGAFVASHTSRVDRISSPAPSILAPSAASLPSSEDLPPLAFSHYFEIDNIPYIKIRNSSYRRGDFVLGFPIEDISPDVVKYRGKYFKVEEISK